MSDQKTVPTDQTVEDFLAGVPEKRRAEAEQVVALFTRHAGVEPEMWGTSIIGWGRYTYRYKTGRTGEWMKLGFSPRAAKMSFYGLKDTAESAAILEGLGTYTEGVGCVYVKKLTDVDLEVLGDLAEAVIRRPDTFEQ